METETSAQQCNCWQAMEKLSVACMSVFRSARFKIDEDCTKRRETIAFLNCVRGCNYEMARCFALASTPSQHSLSASLNIQESSDNEQPGALENAVYVFERRKPADRCQWYPYQHRIESCTGYASFVCMAHRREAPLGISQHLFIHQLCQLGFLFGR